MGAYAATRYTQKSKEVPMYRFTILQEFDYYAGSYGGNDKRQYPIVSILQGEEQGDDIAGIRQILSQQHFEGASPQGFHVTDVWLDNPESPIGVKFRNFFGNTERVYCFFRSMDEDKFNFLAIGNNLKFFEFRMQEKVHEKHWKNGFSAKFSGDIRFEDRTAKGSLYKLHDMS